MNAREILIQLRHDSRYFRGLLDGAGASGLKTFENGSEENKNLVNFLRKLADEIEKEQS